MFIPSVKYEVVLGVLEGYDDLQWAPDRIDNPNIPGINFDEPSILDSLEKWKEYALEYFNLYNTYVSAVAIPHTYAVYNEEWGCPVYGEPVVVFHCTMNPEFIRDANLYELGVVYIAEKLMKFFKQSTVTITKLPAGVCYLKKEEN